MYVPMNRYVCHSIYNFIKNRIVMFKMCTYLFFVFGLLYESSDLFYNPQCLLEMPATATKIFREPEKCDFCRNIAKVDRIENVSSDDFHSNYAILGKPVIVTDGMRDWSAQTNFTFDFFKRLYQNVHGRILSKTCQFFPYKTEFKNLREVFEMSKSRANLVPGEKPWYVGWSNCIDKAGQYLRKYYSKPYFLGNYSENIALSWIFMGGPGNGAQMHVDNVFYSSWQAQIKGKKLWRLAPPPECYNVCQNIEVLVKPGEIIVIDTNRWYHQTAVLPEAKLAPEFQISAKMFFDMIILNPQHRGHFSHAWLAATRGVKFISKETIRGIDISVLCNQLANFITTSSKDPKKRFSLRLSAILLNGTVKIYKEKVLLLQGQVVSALQIIHIPSGSKVRLTSVHREELFETPPTPVVKVKTKRGKKQVVETPTAVASIPEIGFREGELQLPEVEGFIPQATSDLISLREEAPRRTEEHVLEEEGFGVLTGKELEMEIDSLFPRVRAEPVAPLTSSSPSTPAQVMEVVALVHAGRGEFLEKVPEVDDVPRVPEMEIERVLEIEASEQQPIPMEIAEPEVPAIAAIEKHLPAAEITSTAVPPTEEAPIVSANLKKVGVPEERLVLREIQSLAEPVEELREKIAKVREPRKKAEDARKKAGRVIDKLFLRNKRKGFVRINRCNENEGRFVDQSYRLPIEFRNVHNDTLYNIFWFEEEVDGVRDEVRAGSSVRSTSLRTSIALARTPSRLTRSTLDKDLTDSLRRPLSEIETPQKEMPSLGLGEVLIGSEERPRQLPIQEPPVPVRPPSREKMSILDQEPLAVTIGEEPPMVQPSVPEFPLEGVVPTEEFPVPLETVPTVREELSQLQEEIIPSVQEVPPPSEKLLTPTAEKKETPRIPKSPSSDYKLRQQKIVECIKKWNFNERFPTIEDICEKPMTKMNMARAFSDLLILSAKKYIILCTEGESTELKYIKKGPRLE